MKNPKRKRTLRTMLLSALLIAAISGMSAFFAVNASEATEQPAEVTPSDSAEAEEVFSEEVTVRTTQVVISEVVGAKHYRFKPDASYNGSFRSELIANELPIYDALYAEYVTNKSNGTVEVDVSSMGYSKDKMSEVSDLVLSAYAAFTMDHPEVYWVDGYSSSIWMQGSNIVQVDITASERYSDAYSQLSTVESGISSAVSAISASRASGSRYDTAKAIHDYICNQMAYDYAAADAAANAENPADYGEAHCIAPLFGGGSRGKQFVCEGYANSFKLLCDKFGVPAVHIKGEAVTSAGNGGHSWNYVQMEDGKWYGVDSTWDDQSTLMHTYFLVGSGSAVFNGKTFSQDHLPGNQVMSGDTVYPLAYPDLATETYVPGATVPATGITLSKTSLSLTKGVSATLTATVTPSGSTDSVVWTSSNTAVATVSNGVVTAVGNGSATITATAGSKSATCSVTVTTPATGITLSKTSLSLTKGSSATLTATVTPSGSTDSVVWTSSNTAVATVSNGVVKAVGNGSATITATAGSKNATCAVTVTTPATGISLSKTSLSLTKGGSATLTATVTPSNSTDSVVWTSSNTSVATVSNGTVTAVGNGSATITATAGSKSATCTVTVTTPATGISLSKTSLSLTKGGSATLTATVTPSNSTDSVVWTSSNTSVATVSNGTVTAVGNGSATITATAGSKSATCSVTVTEAASETYDVTPNINGGASKLYEPWGLRYFAAFNGEDTDKITDRGIAILKETYYSSGMTPAQFCANPNVHIFLGSRDELAFEQATSANPNGRYIATLTEGIYSYDISAKYYVVPFAVMNNGQTIYGAIKSNSMENILKANLNLSTITQTEKNICTCILELKNSVAAHYEAVGVPGALVDMNIPRGSSQSSATVRSAAETGITANVVGGASRLIEPWGLRYFATFTASDDIVERGMVMLCEKYYQSSYSSSPDSMRLNANAYVFRDSDGTLQIQSETGRYYSTVTEGISSKDIADTYYVVPFAVLSDGSYVYGTVKSNSMMKIMRANLNSSAVPATERAVSEDIIDLYNAVKAYYE